MTLELYGIPESQPTRTVIWALKIHRVLFRLVSTVPGSGTRDPKFLEKFPTGQVPAINDEGFLLSEMVAILIYFADKYKWTKSWHHRNSRELTIRLFAPVIRPELGFSFEIEKSRQILKMLEHLIKSSMTKYLAGDEPTIADLVIYGDVGQLQAKFCDLVDFRSFPNILRWLKAVEKNVPHFSDVHEPLIKFDIYPGMEKTM